MTPPLRAPRESLLCGPFSGCLWTNRPARPTGQVLPRATNTDRQDTHTRIPRSRGLTHLEKDEGTRVQLGGSRGAGRRRPCACGLWGAPRGRCHHGQDRTTVRQWSHPLEGCPGRKATGTKDVWEPQASGPAQSRARGWRGRRAQTGDLFAACAPSPPPRSRWGF